MKFGIKAVQLLDKYFKEEGDSVEVYNCALVGTGSDYGLYQIIKYKLNDLNPDLVLFNCNIPFKVRLRIRESYHGYVIDYPIINKDVGRKKMLQELEIINKARVLRFLYDKSYIVRGIARRIYYDQYFSTKFRNRLWLYVTKKSSHYRNWYDLAPTTKTTIKLLKELDNLKFDVCLFDFFGDTKLKKCCEDNNIPLIFLNCRFSNEHQQKYDGHMNGKGHKLVADSLYVCLRNSYIPTKFLNAEK